MNWGIMFQENVYEVLQARPQIVHVLKKLQFPLGMCIY